jgi:Polysaccharide lyase 14
MLQAGPVSRRSFLGATCLWPWLSACRSSPNAPTDASSSPQTIFQQDFNAATLGPYTAAALAAGWNGTTPYNGVNEGRVSVIDGAEAREGRSLRVLYPRGGVSSNPSGAQWKMTLSRRDELSCAYHVRFASDFDFVLGGKLPGLAGGAANTGGDKPNGRDGWSARMMWRERGEVVQYVYHVDQPTEFGEDFRWNLGGQRVFTPGTWHRVEHRVVINTPGQKNGIVQGWFDGQLALDRRNVRFRDVDTFAVDAFYFSTFFGGSDPTWAPSKDEHVDFDQFMVGIGRL